VQHANPLWRPDIFVVAIEGIIGAGKTTLTAELRDSLGLFEVDEPVEQNPYLDKFYKEPEKWGFPMQMWMVTRRASTLADACARHPLVITDRSLIGDLVFARMHKQSGVIPRDMWPVYSDFWRTAVRLIAPPPDMVIFLDVTPSLALERVQKRARKSEVDGINIDYLRRLSDSYRNVIAGLDSTPELQEWLQGTRIEIMKGEMPPLASIVQMVREQIEIKMNASQQQGG